MAGTSIHDAVSRGRLGVVAHTQFHMFELGKEMQRRGWRVRLCTATPRGRIDPGVAHEVHVRLGWATWSQGLERLRGRGVPLPSPWPTRIGRWASRGLSTWACRFLEDVDVVDALSGWGAECGRFVQAQGGHHVCNRGSTHVLFQKQMLEEEYARWGAGRVQGFPEWAVERELGEYESADAIVVPSGFARRTFLERGVLAHKLHLCPYGVDLSFFSPRPRRDAAFRVLFVGSASIRKGIGYLFDAVRPLVERRHVELWLVGAVSRDARGILARNRTIFSHRGFVPRPRLAELYSQGSVLVLPSVEEGLALVQAQAMACGVPVIATPNTGAEDLFDDGKEGFIVPVRDRTAIRERVAWMIAHPEARRAMGEAALRRVRSRGGWREYGAAVERAYATLCRENLPVAPCSPSQSVTAHGAPNGTRVS